jgi:hypothetical protein
MFVLVTLLWIRPIPPLESNSFLGDVLPAVVRSLVQFPDYVFTTTGIHFFAFWYAFRLVVISDTTPTLITLLF